MRGQPVVFLPLVQKNLEGHDAQRQQRESDRIEVHLAGFEAPQKWRIVYEFVGKS